MANLSFVVAQTDASTAGSNDIGYYAILFALLALITIVMKLVFARRAKAKVARALTGDSDYPPIRIAPAPPFPTFVAELREMLGETSSTPRITRYTVPLLEMDASSLTILDQRNGAIVSIPLANIVSIAARDATIKPKGTVVTRSYPSLWVTLRRDAKELSVAFTPVSGAYGPVSQSDVESFALQLNSRLTTSR